MVGLSVTSFNSVESLAKASFCSMFIHALNAVGSPIF
jgi:hypothetical protein